MTDQLAIDVRGLDKNFGAVRALDGLDLRGRDPAPSDQVAIEHPHTVFPDRTHRDLGVGRHAELAHDDHIEGHVERRGDLGRDRNSAAGEAEHDHVRAGVGGLCGRPILQPKSELAPGIHSIVEHRALANTHLS